MNKENKEKKVKKDKEGKDTSSKRSGIFGLGSKKKDKDAASSTSAENQTPQKKSEQQSSKSASELPNPSGTTTAQSVSTSNTSMKNDNLTLLITGATGTIGKFLLEELLRENKNLNIRACYHKTKAQQLLQNKGIEWVQVEYTDKKSIAKAMNGVNRLLIITPGGSAQLVSSRNIIDCAVAENQRTQKLDRIVKIGSLDGRDKSPACDVELWCAAVEQMVADSKIPYVLLRPSWFNQNFTEKYFAPGIKNWPHTIMAPLGKANAGWIDVRDVAAVAAKSLLQSSGSCTILNKAVTLTGPELIGMDKILPIMRKAADFNIGYYNIPVWLNYTMLILVGMPFKDIRAMNALVGKLRNNQLTHVTKDVEEILGRKAISFEKFAEDSKDTLRTLVPKKNPKGRGKKIATFTVMLAAIGASFAAYRSWDQLEHFHKPLFEAISSFTKR